jgi:hypothetical protein
MNKSTNIFCSKMNGKIEKFKEEKFNVKYLLEGAKV